MVRGSADDCAAQLDMVPPGGAAPSCATAFSSATSSAALSESAPSCARHGQARGCAPAAAGATALGRGTRKLNAR
jgi:hypothetical protein